MRCFSNYAGKPLQKMTRLELLEVLNEVANRLQEKYEKERQRLSDEAYVDYLLGVRYIHQFGGLYKRTIKT